jgi:hypothetical protein
MLLAGEKKTNRVVSEGMVSIAQVRDTAGFGIRVLELGFRVSGFGFWDSGFAPSAPCDLDSGSVVEGLGD